MSSLQALIPTILLSLSTTFGVLINTGFQTAMRQTTAPVTKKKFQHSRGFSFEHPANWQVQEGAEFTQLLPPGANSNDAGENEAYRFLTDTVAVEATDPRFVNELDQLLTQLPGFRRLGTAQSYRTLGGTGIRAVWAANNLETGAAVQIRMFATTLNGLAVVLFAAGKVDRLDGRESALREIAASVGPVRPDTARNNNSTASPSAPSAIDKSPLVQRWMQRLTGKKLTLLSSYNSGSSGGMSSKTEILLNMDGSFQAYSESSVSIYVPGANGSSGGTRRAKGRWRIYTQSGQAILETKYDNGETETNLLEDRGGQTFINGKRWFVTEQ